MNGSRSEIFSTEAARSACVLVCLFVFSSKPSSGGGKKRSIPPPSAAGSPHVYSACVHTRVFACVPTYTRRGRRGGGGAGGFCWMSHIVPVRPGDIAGGQSGMEPEIGDSDK